MWHTIMRSIEKELKIYLLGDEKLWEKQTTNWHKSQ